MSEKQGIHESPPTYNSGADMRGLPPPMAGTQSTTVVVTNPELPPTPVSMQCPNCHTHIVTEITLVNGALVWLAVIALFLIGCVLGCCLIPLCIPDIKDVEHRCPQCKAYIGTKKRL